MSKTPQQSLWLKNPAGILAQDAGGGVLIRNGWIEELVPSGGQPSASDWNVFDASSHVVIPGLINTHHHFFQTLTRAFPPALNKTLFPWLGALFPVWAHLDESMIQASCQLAMAELLLSGCTTVADHHYLFNDALDNAIDIQVDAAKALGVRGVFARGAIDETGVESGNAPASMAQQEHTILDHMKRLLQMHHQHEPGAMVQIAPAPCSPFQVTPDLMRESAKLARSHGAPLHTHLAETAEEVRFCENAFGYRTVDYLEDVDWLNNDVWLAHGIHFSNEEIERLGRAGVAISHCPSSNAVLASGACPVPALEHAGCGVGLGVDGSASNDCSNLIQEVRQAFLQQRMQHGIDAITHEDALRWASEGSARCLRRPELGRIETGQCADLALFKLDEPRFSGAHDPIAALVLCGAHRADRVMVQGKWVVADGQLVHMDIQKLQHQQSEAVEQLKRHAG